MPVRTIEYSEEKLNAEYERLKRYAQLGRPLDYEVKVDGVKAVLRTNDPEVFRDYEMLMDEHTTKVEVLLYNGNSNYNDRHIYVIGGKKEEQGLSGIDVDGIVQDALEKERERHERELIKRENESLRQQIASQQKEIQDLEKENERLEGEKEAIASEQSPFRNVLGDVGSSLLESFIKRNPKVLKGIGGESLAGLLGPDEVPQGNAPEETATVSFKPSSKTNEEKEALEFVNYLKHTFSKEEFDQIVAILQKFSEDKAKITSVLNQLI